MSLDQVSPPDSRELHNYVLSVMEFQELLFGFFNFIQFKHHLELNIDFLITFSRYFVEVEQLRLRDDSSGANLTLILLLALYFLLLALTYQIEENDYSQKSGKHKKGSTRCGLGKNKCSCFDE